jgi:TldD protein
MKIDRREMLRSTAGTFAAAATPLWLPATVARAADKRQAESNEAMNGYFDENFGVGPELIRKTLTIALQSGGEYAEIFLQHRVRDSIGFEDGRVNDASVNVDLGAGVRVLIGDQTGYAFTEDLSPEALAKAATTAASIARKAPTDRSLEFNRVEIPDLYPRRRIWFDVPAKEKLALASTVGEKILAGDPSMVKANVRVQNEDEVLLVANTAGDWAEDTRPLTRIYATAVAEQDGRRESYLHRISARRGIDYYAGSQLDDFAEHLVGCTLRQFEATQPPAGAMPVVLAPGTSGILLHEAMGHGFEADFNRKGVSIYSNMMGKKIAADFVTIYDSGTIANERGAISVDDEGTPGKETVLVKDGRLVSYLHDRISSRQLKTEPTGNGRRQSFRYAPIPRMRVTAMAAGPHDPEEIVKSVKRGIYAENFSNGQVMIGAGDYSFYLRSGYLIEDGKLTQPIKDANLIGNGPDTLLNTVMVGNDMELAQDGGTCGKDGQWVPVGVGIPTVKVSSITVGGVNA